MRRVTDPHEGGDAHDSASPIDESLLRDVLSTPVGRRWVLKAGLGSAAAAVLWTSPDLGDLAAAERRGADRPARVTAATVAAGPTTPTTLQFALGEASGISELALVANGERQVLVAHDAASRNSLKAEGGLFASMDLSALSHYAADVALPASQTLVLSVQGKRDGRDVVVSQSLYVPAAATLALAQMTESLGKSPATAVGSSEALTTSPRLKSLGVSPASLSSPEAVAQLDTIVDPHQTAVAFTMCHPNVATKDATTAATTKSLLGQTAEVTTLGTQISALLQAGKDWATITPATDKDGSPAEIKVGDDTITLTVFQLKQDDAGFTETVKSAVSAGVQGVRDSGDLGTVIDTPLDLQPPGSPAQSATWVQPQGVTATAQPYTAQLADAPGLDILVKNTGAQFGITTTVNGSYSNGQVPLKLYNNYLRWVWVYVQYLGAQGENLSINGDHKFPDTQYSKSLGLMPQIFTVFGIPLWDTNTLDVSLDFPTDAHTARILYCGLGNSAVDDSWRQYFPTDAYSGRIAPTDEVTVAAVITGILTIGLNAFALVLDFDVGIVWKAVADAVEAMSTDATSLKPVVVYLLALTGVEATAGAVISGYAGYEDVHAGDGDASNLWSILLSLGSVIPRVLFNQGFGNLWYTVAKAVLATETANKVALAIPYIGEVLAVISVLGDVATLAEVGAETGTSPWVIENEVNVTYHTTVTVHRDPRAATFPATATQWRLEALVDGALTLSPITGPVNAGGHTQSDPLVLELTAPFGGQVIQWSIVFQDADGFQVGTGVSPQYTNDDPSQVASTVDVTITELPEPITAATVFKRADTTAYSTSAGGYTWSNQVTDTATVKSTGIDEVTGVAVATTLGVAAVTWKADDRFYVRGVPVAENGNTIKLGTTSKEGFARRPFVLLDTFVGKDDVANHLLLEPDETTDAYLVRKVTLDPDTGDLTWDASVSYGNFPLPVSAAALHSSGQVVVIHTDSGRLGRLQPATVATAAQGTAALGAYTAGPGTQVGLLQNPVALAVTNPGVVLVLETGPAQLAAFDLNGNPIAYFNAAYTVALPTGRTYLDLAVDGASQIYVLSYAGDGSSPADYFVDVYTPTGQPLVTTSPGVNVAHLAVDYWRSIYGANFDPLDDLGTTNPHVDTALGVREPSISRFDPVNPPAPS